MFISSKAIIDSLINLESLHPFFGITFLVCKEKYLPIGNSIEFSINNIETKFLEEYYRPIKETEKFFRVFRTSEKLKFWLNSDYASSGSQANRTQNFADAFIHPKNSNLWGWNKNYIPILKAHLGKKRIPLWHLAIWIFKDFDWPLKTTNKEVVKKFIGDFNITPNELEVLFNSNAPKSLDYESFFSAQIFDWYDISQYLNIPPPPDMPIEKGGSLVNLKAQNIANIDFEIDLKSRLNIITGDNGLGKSFILECAWWALTGTWTGFPFYPNYDNRNLKKNDPEISFKISNKQGRLESFISKYNWRSQNWELLAQVKKTIPGLIIYARVDGAFAIYDPARSDINNTKDSIPANLIFSREDIWNGVRLEEGFKSRSIFNGLITDWVHWQNSNNEAFNILKKVLKRLSPPGLNYGDLGMLEPGKIVRLPGESRPIPTIKHSYGEVPVTFASAAVKRVIAFAYLIVWTWEEHKTASELIRESPETKMVVIADELESHLHPQWQRLILPALSSISEDLSSDLNIQFLITTHSPLVMASVEPLYNQLTDKVFHLNLKKEKGNMQVFLETPDFQKRGSADSWLTSEIFELAQPRSIAAEEAIEQAKKAQMLQKPNKEKIVEVSKKLMKVLPPHDTFWIRWNYFAEQNGVTLE